MVFYFYLEVQSQLPDFHTESNQAAQIPMFSKLENNEKKTVL